MLFLSLRFLLLTSTFSLLLKFLKLYLILLIFNSIEFVFLSSEFILNTLHLKISLSIVSIFVSHRRAIYGKYKKNCS